jgi:hypothetical protein
MKTRLTLIIIMTFLALSLAACQPGSTDEDAAPVADTVSENQPEDDQAYPAQEYETRSIDAAYPVTEEDLQLLIGDWVLSTRSEDQINKEPESKTITFKADGSYKITIDQTSTTGMWTARLSAIESTLILDPGTEETLMFEIIELRKSQLNLRSIRDNVEIDELYLPQD